MGNFLWVYVQYDIQEKEHIYMLLYIQVKTAWQNQNIWGNYPNRTMQSETKWSGDGLQPKIVDKT